MTRIVRLEEIDGDLVLRVPADIAARLKFVAGEEVAVSDDRERLSVSQLDERLRKQLELGRKLSKRTTQCSPRWPSECGGAGVDRRSSGL